VQKKNMPRKLRKGRAKRKAQSSRRFLAAKEVSQRPQSLPLSSKQAPAAKSAITMTERADHYRHTLSDMKRSIIVGGVSLLVLIILYFSLR